MNWGTGLALAMGLFIAMMGTLVYKSVQQDLPLVTEQYYEASLDYGRVQQGKSNYAALGSDITASVADGVLSVGLPGGFDGAEGSVYLYFAADATQDRTYALADARAVSTEGMRPGKWTVRVNRSQDGREYQAERVVFIQ